MTDSCYLAELGDPRPGDVVLLAGSEGYHAAVVKRTRVGESVLVTDGRGLVVRGVAIEVTRQRLHIRVAECLRAEPRTHLWTVVQALAKGDRPEIAVATLTELGVDQILAWQAARSVVRWETRDGTETKAGKGVARWQATARESTKQSRRLRVPRVGYADTARVCALISGSALALICHRDARLPLAEVRLPSCGEVTIVVGPEGGITESELASFTTAGGLPVSLTDGVLRTSSAATVALAQLRLLAQIQQNA